MIPFSDNPKQKSPKAKTEKKPRSSGVGESKTFIAEPGTFPEPDPTLTVDGVPIPQNMVHLVPYDQTDQGRAENNAGKQPARVQIVRDDVDKSVEHYRDDLLADLPLIENHDPLRLIVDKFTPPGMRGLMMSKRKCDREGMRRGVLDYEPVLVDKDGKKERVEHGGMFLGAVPEQLAQRADKHYAGVAKDRMVNAVEKVQAQTEEFMTESNMRSVKRAGRGEYDGIQQEQGDMIVNDLTHEFVG